MSGPAQNIVPSSGVSNTAPPQSHCCTWQTALLVASVVALIIGVGGMLEYTK